MASTGDFFPAKPGLICFLTCSALRHIQSSGRYREKGFRVPNALAIVMTVLDSEISEEFVNFRGMRKFSLISLSRYAIRNHFLV